VFAFSVPGARLPFPSLFEPPSLDLSVVIPAYNEELRLPVMLDESVDYLSRNFGQNFEIVDDGSIDRTTHVALVRDLIAFFFIAIFHSSNKTLYLCHI
jgi:dolichyl-phosphate beta-glucosyltransferase